MAAQSSGPTFPVHVDERELAEDLHHATEAGRSAIESTIERLKADGVSKDWLRQCDAEARDGTRLGGCVKLYIRSMGRRVSRRYREDKPTLFLLAVGERHPGARGRPSVYEIAHRRMQKRASS